MTEAQAASLRAPPRSMGLKLLLVCGLALLMAIPALFVFGLLHDRTSRAQSVVNEIGGLVGGPQTFLGPVIGVPYAVPATPAPGTAGQTTGSTQPTRAVYLVFPAQGSALVATKSEVRQRSLFRVPVYHASLDLHARFDLAGSPRAAPAGAALDWSHAELLVAVSDPRGAQADIVATVDGRNLAFAPASVIAEAALGEDAQGVAKSLRFFGAPLPVDLSPQTTGQPRSFPIAALLKFSGASRLAVLPFAKTTDLRMTGDWPSPSFDGGFLPSRRSVSRAGFDATWSVPFIARGVPAEGGPDTLARLGQDALGLSFVEPADPYQAVARSLKYALLFVGLVFLAYFVFEATTGRRVHPAQYVLIGLAQMVFYLLLLSLAERIGFDPAFLLAAAATVGLISAYAGWVFESRGQGLRALGAFSLLYGLIYMLMRLEDLALLVGAVASFGAIAAVMYLTRKLDWYGVAALAPPSPSQPRSRLDLQG